jgi:hypothetical protein
MRKIIISLIFASSFLIISLNAATNQSKAILVGTQLEGGFGMGVDSSGRLTDWVTKVRGAFRLSYPAGQSWGAVFVTVGKPKDPPRPFENFSSYKSLIIDMKGASGGELVFVGVKTNTQPDDGNEVKMSIKLTKEWHTYHFPLEAFKGTDSSRLYVVSEFVFEGPVAQSILVRKISFGE